MFSLLIHFFLILSSFYANFVLTENGFDATMPITVSQFKQFIAANYTRFIARIQKNNGQTDQIGIINLKNAIEAGYSNSIYQCDSYIFPCTNNGACPPGYIQVNNTLTTIKTQNITSPGVIWLDIENPKSWYDNIKDNRNFIDGMIKAVRAAGYRPGIYTSENAWISITGNLTDYGGYLPLWWMDHNGFGEPNCEGGWKSFGGWKYPYLYQFDKNYLKFGVTFDPNC